MKFELFVLFASIHAAIAVCGPEWSDSSCEAAHPDSKAAVLHTIVSDMKSTCLDEEAICYCETCPKQQMDILGLKGVHVCTIRRRYCAKQSLRGFG